MLTIRCLVPSRWLSIQRRLPFGQSFGSFITKFSFDTFHFTSFFSSVSIKNLSKKKDSINILYFFKYVFPWLFVPVTLLSWQIQKAGSPRCLRQKPLGIKWFALKHSFVKLYSLFQCSNTTNTISPLVA